MITLCWLVVWWHDGDGAPQIQVLYERESAEMVAAEYKLKGYEAVVVEAKEVRIK